MGVMSTSSRATPKASATRWACSREVGLLSRWGRKRAWTLPAPKARTAKARVVAESTPPETATMAFS